MQAQSIKITKLVGNTGQIKGLPKNPRFIRDEKFQKLVKSIQDDPEMLELRELLVIPHDKQYVVIGGNMRLRAMIECGHKDAPCKVLDKATPPEKLRAYAAKDNVGFGEWDWEQLANEWDAVELADWGLDLPVDFGAETNEGLTDPDEVPEVPETPVTVLGDVWVMGKHRLLCGDSTITDDLAKLTNDQMVDMWLTDPPYNVAYEGKTKDALTIKNDQMGDDHFRQFLRDACTAADTVMKPGAVFYIWHADLEGYNFRGAAQDAGWKVRQCLIWKKSSMVMGRQDYHWKHEPCLYGWKEGAGHLWASDRKQTTILEFEKPSRNGEHPTMKPVALFEYQLLNNTKGGDQVLDSFGGSGTTLIAAEKNGRIARIMELDPKYCDVIVKRWQDFTGQQAIHEANGKTFAELSEAQLTTV